MRSAVRWVLLLGLLVLGSCAAPGPSFSTVQATLPPLPAGHARIFFYRLLEPYETLSQSTVYLNRQPVGVSQTGAVLYRDIVPGEYFISVFSPGLYPNQFKTVTVAPGQTLYVRIESLASWAVCSRTQSACQPDTFVVAIVDPATGLAEMRDLRFIPG